MALDSQNDGEVLTRRDYGAEGAPELFRYLRCGE